MSEEFFEEKRDVILNSNPEKRFGSAEEYKAHMQQDGKYSGDIEFLLISQFWNTNVIVYGIKGKKQLKECGSYGCELADDTKEILHTGKPHAGH